MLLLFVSHSFYCEHDYLKSNQPISLKLGIMNGPTNGDQSKELVKFWWCTVPYCGSLFDSPHHCGTGNFRRFISISHTSLVDFYYTRWNDWPQQNNESTTYAEKSGRHPEIRIGIHFRRLGRGLRSLSTVQLSLTVMTAKYTYIHTGEL